jgi:hypothetical protein
MEVGKFFQAIFEHWFAEALLVIGGVALGYLRKKTAYGESRY